MIELKPLPTYSGIWLRNGSILNFYKTTGINKEDLTKKFLVEFGKMSSFFPVYSFTNNVEIRMNSGDICVLFKNQSISREYISSLKKNGFYLKIDVVEHPIGFAPFVLLEDRYNKGFFFEKRIFSYRIQNENVQRINNNDKWFCSKTVYARDLYNEYIKEKNSKITYEEYLKYAKLFNHIISYILRTDHICDFKSPHLGSNTHIFYQDNENNKRVGEIKYWEDRMRAVLPLRYDKDNPIFAHHLYFFAIPLKDTKEKGFDINKYNKEIRLYKYPEMAVKKYDKSTVYVCKALLDPIVIKDSRVRYVENVQEIFVKQRSNERLPHKILINE